MPVPVKFPQPYPKLLLAQQEALIERLQRKLQETRVSRDVQAKNFKIHEDGWEAKFYSLALLAEELGATQGEVARIFSNEDPLRVIADSYKLRTLTDRVREERERAMDEQEAANLAWYTPDATYQRA